jgi:hypothetical protein
MQVRLRVILPWYFKKGIVSHMKSVSTANYDGCKHCMLTYMPPVMAYHNIYDGVDAPIITLDKASVLP